MQTVTKIMRSDIKSENMTVPNSLKPKKLMPVTTESIDFMSFISSQHPLINMWLVFSFISIGILSVLLFAI
ncbi:hypothetical protein IJ732_07640 [bacterium]|nr:hypothetical protein [bacterium]